MARLVVLRTRELHGVTIERNTKHLRYATIGAIKMGDVLDQMVLHVTKPDKLVQTNAFVVSEGST
jgi:hypothetical protein